MLTRAYHHALNSSTIAPGEPVLDIVDIGLHFGGVTALKDVGFRVTQGHIHSVIGPNGAGKSSLLNCISGLYHPQEGSIHLHTASGSHELTAMQPHRIARLGVARSFQNIELFTHPVSYTHLDVYKRQSLPQRPLCHDGGPAPDLSW